MSYHGSDIIPCNLHTIGNHYAKYEQTRSKNERGVRITSRKYVTLIIDSKVIAVFLNLRCNLHIMNNTGRQSLCKNMKSLGQKNKIPFTLRAVRQILSVCDLDL